MGHQFITAKPEIESGSGQIIAQRLLSSEQLFAFLGKPAFEDICLQFLRRMNRAGQLPFIGTSFGSWWGNDSKEKRQADIDVIMADRGTKQILLGECKWRKEAPAPATVAEFLAKDYLISQYQQFYHCFFSKAPFGEEIRRLERSGAIRLFDLYSLFAEGL